MNTALLIAAGIVAYIGLMYVIGSVLGFNDRTPSKAEAKYER